jgi:hypothetical protein
MKTWATVAIKHVVLTSGLGLGAVHGKGWDSINGLVAGLLLAGLGFAALESSRRIRSCPLPSAAPGCGYQPHASASAARARRQMGGLLAGILSDHGEFVPPAAILLSASAAREDSEQVWASRQYPRHAASRYQGSRSRRTADSAGWSRLSSGYERGHTTPRDLVADESFWGRRTIQGGYHSRHRLHGSATNARPHDRRRAEPRRSGPRHAAPHGRFGGTLSRTLVGQD